MRSFLDRLWHRYFLGHHFEIVGDDQLTWLCVCGRGWEV